MRSIQRGFKKKDIVAIERKRIGRVQHTQKGDGMLLPIGGKKWYSKASFER